MHVPTLRRPQTGLVKVAAFSLFLHVVLLAIAIFLVKDEPKRVFFTPVYTVNLVDGPSALPGFVRQAAPIRDAGESPGPLEKERQKDGNIKTKTIKEASHGTVRAPQARALESALKEIERKVEARELVAGRIEAMRKKTLSASSLGQGRGRQKEESSSGQAGKDGGKALASAGGQGRGGVSAESLDVKYRAYLGYITERVQEQWEFPVELNGSGISVIVSLKIGRDGRLISSWVEKSSGQTLFDESLMKAVTKAAPYPALPAGLEGDFLELGLRFCPGCGG